MEYNNVNFNTEVSDRLITKPIKDAIDTCFLSGREEVIIPKVIWKTGSFRLRSGIMLHFLSDTIMEDSEDPAEYFGWMNDVLKPLTDLPDVG